MATARPAPRAPLEERSPREAEPFNLYGPPPAAPAEGKDPGLPGLLRKFRKNEKLCMVTAYDFPSAQAARRASIDLVLCGDSYGNCRLGLPSTVGVGMDDMLRATLAVRRGLDAPHSADKPVLVGDMPFGSYLTEEDCLKNACALVKQGAAIVKLEGGRPVAKLAERMTQCGIAVMGHCGLAPQRALVEGGLKTQGTSAQAALDVVADAQALERAGCVAIVLECVPEEVGRLVQQSVQVPIIGIGAGPGVAGQVLVCDDLLGVHGTPPSFVKVYADLAAQADAALQAFRRDVKQRTFPAAEHSKKMAKVHLQELAKHVQVPAPEPEPLPSPRARVGARQLATQRTAPQLLKDKHAVRAWRGADRVALVPTMGGLHDGHLELVAKAKQSADRVVVSVFVNPAQFAAHEDFGRYPRTLESDLAKLAAVGADAVYAPTAAELYPSATPGNCVVVPKFVAGLGEAASRPHFFTGVATVCLKLLNVCRPDVVVFGQKDAVQCSVIRELLKDLLLDIELVVCPTSREPDGLARSSRNRYLTASMRQQAPEMFAALSDAAAAATAGEAKALLRERLAAPWDLQYASCADHLCAELADHEDLRGSTLSVGATISDGDAVCRLIDNVVVPA